MFPFATWYAQEFRNWGTYIKRHPGEFGAKFMVPLAALWYWNNHIQHEQEKSLPDWQKEYPLHLNTGYKTEDGKDIIYAANCGLGVVGRVVRVERLPHAAGRYARGEISAEEALRQGLSGPAWTLYELGLQQKKGPRAGMTRVDTALATLSEGVAKM